MIRKEIKNIISIKCSKNVVWDVLTKSEYTAQYMFGCSVKTDWKVGSPLHWEMKYEGKPFIPVTGYILEIEPKSLLEYSVIDPTAPYEATPQNHLKVRYSLDIKDNTTILSVLQYGFEEAEDGEKRYVDVYNNGEGWQPILDQIKTICESVSTQSNLN